MAQQADAVTLDCTTEAATQELEIIELASAEHTVTAMGSAGRPTLLAVAARTVLVDPAAAEAYLTRLRRSGGWLDQISERLEPGGKGRLPVAPLAEQAVSLGRGGSWPGPAPRGGAFPAAAAGVAPSGGVGGGTPGGRRGGGQAGAGEVGRHRQGTAPAGPAVRPGRTGLPARR